MRKILLLILAGVMTFTAAGLLPVPQAAAAEPVAVVALASYDELAKDVQFVGKLADKPDLAGVMEGLIAMFTQGKGLAGLDKSRPIGIVVEIDDMRPTGYVFLPVTDVKQMLGVLELFATITEEGGIYKIAPNDGKKPSYLKASGGWAFLGEKAECLPQATIDPGALLGGMDKHYLLSGKFLVAKVPESMRTMVTQRLQTEATKNLKPEAKESPAVFAARKAVVEAAVKQLATAINELDQVTLGLVIDRTAETVAADLGVTARSGTALAGQLDQATKGTTLFSGFRLPGATLTATKSQTLTPDLIPSLTGLVDTIRTRRWPTRPRIRRKPSRPWPKN